MLTLLNTKSFAWLGGTLGEGASAGGAWGTGGGRGGTSGECASTGAGSDATLGPGSSLGVGACVEVCEQGFESENIEKVGLVKLCFRAIKLQS